MVNRKALVYVIVIVLFILGMGNAYGKVRFISSGKGKASEKTAVIKGANIDEVLSKTGAIRKARSMFSGYSIKNDNKIINEKLKRLKKR